MEIKNVQLTINDLAKASRRIGRLIEAEERFNAFLCRSSDDCWSYPNADEKYEMYLNKMNLSDERITTLEEAQEAVQSALSKLEPLLES